MKEITTSIVLIVSLIFISNTDSCAQWVPTNGPVGGNISSLAIAGDTVFAGTNDLGGKIFYSTNSGTDWQQHDSNHYAYMMFARRNKLFVGTFSGLVIYTNDRNVWTKDTLKVLKGNRFSYAINDSSVYIGTDEAGLYKSNDNGTNWIQVYPRTVSSVIISESNLLIGTGFGLLLSTNNGSTWSDVNNGITNIVLSFSKVGEKLFARTWDSVFISTNNGLNWTNVNSDVTNKNGTCIVASGANYFAGTSSGIYVSTDSGESWTPTKNELTNKTVSSLILNGSKLFAGTAGSGIYLSTNNGEIWTQVDTGLPKAEITCLTSFSDGAGGMNLLAGSYESGVFITNNNGSSWASISSGLPNSKVTCLAMDALGTEIFAGTEKSGVFRSTNYGEEWNQVNQGLTSTSISSIAISSDGTKLFVGTDGVSAAGIFISTNNGQSWTQAKTGLTSLYISSLAVNDTCLFAATMSGVFLSTNNGTSWMPINNGIASSSSFVKSLIINGPNLFCGASGGCVYHSTNNGSNWTDYNACLYYITEINSFAVSGDNLFAGTGSGIFLYSDGGKSRTAVHSGLQNRIVTSLVTSKTDLYAGNRLGVWRRPLTEMITQVVDEYTKRNIHSKFSLEQNYPNPFNPITNISFSIPKVAYVSLKVFDVLGRELLTLIDEEKMIGSYKVEFDGSKFSSGIYFYQMRAGNFTDTKKLLLIK